MSQPHILLITTDQQRYDATGQTGPSFLRTPHFDHLCREGIRFDGARADCPICVPARASWMTGKTVFGHGLDGNGPTTALGRENTLPALLRRCGYQTLGIGKMHFEPMRARHGFDEILLPDDYYREMERSGNPLQPMRHGLGQNEIYPSMATVPESMTLTSWIAEKGVEFIRERRDPTAPFFLWCSFSKPHPPLDPPEPYYSMYRNCKIPEPVFGDWSEDERCPVPFARHRESWSCDLVPPDIIREARAAYYGLITQIDYNMGRVFAALQDQNIFKDTLILYISDHGEFLGDHHSGGKFSFHEGSCHVPLALRLPSSWENRPEGVCSNALVTHADVMPTLLEAARGEIPNDMEGISLVSLARGETSPREFLEGTAMNGNFFGITDGRWKYVYCPEGASEQLFDLKNDPQELHDLFGQAEAEDHARRLREEMLRRHQQRGSEWVRDGDFIRLEPRGDTTAQRRSRPWPGYHTPDCGLDVCH
jgi:arylsulfatase A-like enzyme